MIGPIGAKAFEGRGIDLETAIRYGVFTGLSDVSGTVTPDMIGNIVAFPYFVGEEVVAEKYRGPGKKFWQRKGGVRTFWNVNALDDPGLEDGSQSLVITEGELDALTAIDCGFPLSVSVPDGAPAVQKGEDPLDLPPEDLAGEKGGKFEFLWHNRTKLKKTKKFILAVDTDAPGRRLEAELLRRLGPARCAFAKYPDGCKDLSDVRQKHGRQAVIQCLNGATPYPINGVYTLSDYPDVGEPEVFSTGYPDLDEYIKLWPGELFIVTGIPGHGKALALDTEVPTPNGWTTMGALQVGDVVYDEMGVECRVMRVSDIKHDRPCYELTFDDGTKIIADAEHQWLTVSEKARRSSYQAAIKRNGRESTRFRGTDQRHKRTFPSVVTTEEISLTLISQGKRNHQIPLCKPVAGRASLLPIDPYTLGAWLGDGTSRSGGFTCFDEEIIDKIVANGSPVTAWHAAGQYNIVDMKRKLRILGLLENKHIPDLYLSATVKDREELLRGLMDTDGSCSKDRQCEITITNRAMAYQILELSCGLGLKASISEGTASIDGRVIGPKYRVQFVSTKRVFHLSRKYDRQRCSDGHRLSNRVIVSCRQVPSVPVCCIQVDSPNSLFLVTRSFVPTHNSCFINNMAVRLAEIHGWKVGIASFEIPVVPHLRRSLRLARCQRPYGEHTRPLLDEIDGWLNEHFVFIAGDPSGETDEDLTLEWLKERADEAVLRYGIKVLIIDPWNEVEHARPHGESESEYQNRALRMLRRFAARHKVIVIVVAHPTKSVMEDGKIRVPILYDISGSAAWYNKPDHGITVYVPDPNIGETIIYINKVRFAFSGKKGDLTLAYLPGIEGYGSLNGATPLWKSKASTPGDREPF